MGGSSANTLLSLAGAILAWLASAMKTSPSTAPIPSLAVPPIGGRFRLGARRGRRHGLTLHDAVDLRSQDAPHTAMLVSQHRLSKATRDALIHSIRAAAMLPAHPSIARPVSVFGGPDLLVVITEPIAAASAVCATQSGRLPLADLLPFATSLLDGLTHLHDAGLTAGLLDAHAVRWDDGRAQLAGLGLAPVALEEVRAMGNVALSSGYLSPSRRNNNAPTPQDDLFAAAMLLGRLATGCAPLQRQRRRGWNPGGALPSHPEMSPALYALLEDAIAGGFDDAESMKAALLALVPSPEGDRADMCRIPQRTVSVGRSTHTVAPFWMDTVPVTNKAYAAFIKETGRLPPNHWLGSAPPAGKDDHPVVGVSLDDARSYAAWAGKRLPTSAEWRAAAGGSAQRFPWGASCQSLHCRCPTSGPRETAPVLAHPDGRSVDGCLDLIGNVWEWTEPDPALPPPRAGNAPVFGGSFRHHCGGGVPATEVLASSDYQYLGFRCAMEI